MYKLIYTCSKNDELIFTSEIPPDLRLMTDEKVVPALSYTVLYTASIKTLCIPQNKFFYTYLHLQI